MSAKAKGLKSSEDSPALRLMPGRPLQGYTARDWRLLAADLQSVVLRVPYDSAAPVVAAQPHRQIRAVSGNCIHQASELTRRLISHAPTAEVRYFRDDRHHAVLFRIGELCWLYLDPYLMQLVPLPMVADGRSRSALSAPRIDGRLGRTSITLNGSRLTVTKAIPRQNGEYAVTHQFEGDLPAAIVKQLPNANDREIAFHPEVTTLSVRVVSADFEVQSLVYSLTEQAEYGLDARFQRIYPASPAFASFTDQLAQHLDRDGSGLRAYLNAARVVYDAETAESIIDYVFPNSINGGDPNTPLQHSR